MVENHEFLTLSIGVTCQYLVVLFAAIKLKHCGYNVVGAFAPPLFAIPFKSPPSFRSRRQR